MKKNIELNEKEISNVFGGVDGEGKAGAPNTADIVSEGEAAKESSNAFDAVGSVTNASTKDGEAAASTIIEGESKTDL
ncbi:MAG: hypothetical protein WCH10_03580 [bacterium]